MVAFARGPFRAALLGAWVLLGVAPALATEQPAAAASMVKAQAPDYPPAARRRDQEGTVHVRVRVLASGRAGEVGVQRSSGIPELDQAAVAAVKGSEFRAARDAAGDAVESWVVVPYKFVLKD